jgi:hypothetical protein
MVELSLQEICFRIQDGKEFLEIHAEPDIPVATTDNSCPQVQAPKVYIVLKDEEELNLAYNMLRHLLGQWREKTDEK